MDGAASQPGGSILQIFYGCSVRMNEWRRKIRLAKAQLHDLLVPIYSVRQRLIERNSH